MPDKLTDSEIVKALECCINWKREGDCAKCPLWESEPLCIKNIRILALNLINRLQAENERLRNVKSHIDILIHRGVEYPTAETYNKAFQKALEKLYDNTNSKTEAYKEVEEKISETTWYHINKNGELVIGANSEMDIPLFKAEDVFNLLKELVGDNNES